MLFLFLLLFLFLFLLLFLFLFLFLFLLLFLFLFPPTSSLLFLTTPSPLLPQNCPSCHPEERSDEGSKESLRPFVILRRA